jgi:D-alanine-D-alanine ligase
MSAPLDEQPGREDRREEAAASMHVLVLMGGDSPEREVSLASGRAVSRALRSRGHAVEEAVVGSMADVLELPGLRQADLVFPALHGGFGEDGHLQAVLDVLGVAYALSGPLACALSMDKALTKRLMRGAAIPTPLSLLIQQEVASGGERGDRSAGKAPTAGPPAAAPEGEDPLVRLWQRVNDELAFPVVIKPNGAGSSHGVEIVHEAAGLPAAYARVAKTAAEVLIERYVPGREVTAAILFGRRLPLLEIRPRAGFYDYANKYTPGASEYLVPAPLHSPLYEQISDDALRLYDLLDCRGMARIDFRVDGDSYGCLELNTIPGLTETSLVPKAAAAVGIGFEDLVEDLCRFALADDSRAARHARGGP